MSSILKISEAASIGIHAIVYMAGQPGVALSSHDIADYLNVSENHLSKVLQRLAKSGLIKAVRGPGGGYMVEKDAVNISLLEVYESVDGPIPQEGCILDPSKCVGSSCIMGGLIQTLNKQVRDYLAAAKLSDLMGTFPRERSKAC